MKKNMGSFDKAIRILVALFIVILYFLNLITGTAAIVMLVIAGAFILTSFISFCPLYVPFGFSTCAKAKKR